MDKYYAILYKGVYISKMRSHINHPYGESVEISEHDFLMMPIPCDLNFNPVTSLDMPIESISIAEQTHDKEQQSDTESDILSMMVDHEYRLTLLELGITE